MIPLGIIGGSSFIATGGNFTVISGGYKYHVFTSAGTFAVTAGSKNCEILAIGGGGSGGASPNNTTQSFLAGGGGGAGGVIHANATLNTGTSFAVVVGAGGAGHTNASTTIGENGFAGSDTTVNGTTVIAKGGGYGAGGGTAAVNGGAGGSGGGAHAGTSTGTGVGGTATAGSVASPASLVASYANAGGIGNIGSGSGTTNNAGGGGGAGRVGYDASAGIGGDGGDPTSAFYDWLLAIAPSMPSFWQANVPGNGIAGGGGGGGDGVGTMYGFGGTRGVFGNIASASLAALANTGSGSGGTKSVSGFAAPTVGAGGSGLVIIRYAA